VAVPRVCRHCRGTLDPFLDLGALQLTGYLAPDEAARPTAPLVLCACSDCKLVQLAHTVAPDLLFRQYWYRSGVNEVMAAELRHVVQDAVARVGGLSAQDTVLDLGANDGTLLACYPRFATRAIYRIAYEPARNLLAPLRAHADHVVSGYFPAGFPMLTHHLGRMKIITSIAMVYAVDDLAPFLTAIAALLHQDGVWVVQFQDLAGMLQATAFDNVCHEHLCYFSLASFSALLQPYGLQVTHAERRAINGGSYRLIVQHRGHAPDETVATVAAWETGCQHWAHLEHFAWRTQEVSRQIRAALSVLLERGEVIDLYGASTKANTLLQVCGLNHEWLRQAWERSPEKVGRRTAGTDIPIVDEATGRADPPAALLVGIWQFREAVLAREADYLAGRGLLLFPLPAVDVVMRQ
jgi:NDP-4-keto-2,6-dideoxyhexose 3-C-methyltransferase